MAFPRLLLVNFIQPNISVVVSPGTTLLEAARRAGINLEAECNGQGTCGECCVTILEGKVSEVSKDEIACLEENGFPVADSTRLACFTRVYSPVKVLIHSSTPLDRSAKQ